MPIRVFVVDDSDVFLDAVRDVLDACPDFELVGESHSGEGALSALQGTTPDLVLIDVQLPGIDGLETCRRVGRLSSQPFVILCSVGEDPRGTNRLRGDAPFLPKARISPSSLRATWQLREIASSAAIGG
jgi:two-component system, NarL family, invasion response regulator UvrY